MRRIALTLAVVIVGCWGGSTQPAENQAASEEAIPAEGIDSPLSDRTLRPVRYPAKVDAHDANVVLFLPTINRTQYRIHPSYLDAVDRTLAAHAAAHLGLEIVRPEIANRLASDIGMANGRWGHFAEVIPADTALEAISRRVGAGTVVWGELRRDESLVLHSRAWMEGAPAEVWQGVVLESGGSIDETLYDAPARLLAQLAKTGRAPGINCTSPGDVENQRLAEIRAMVRTGHPVNLRRAETDLARLAMANPSWGSAWAELAFLRMLRGTLRSNKGREAGPLAEGPNPARHLARQCAPLEADAQARLDTVDHLFLRHRRPPTALYELIGRAPFDARLLLALWHPYVEREVFALEDGSGDNAFERFRVAVANATDGADRLRRAVASGESVPQEQTLFEPYVARAMTSLHREQGDWSQEGRWSLRAVPAHASAVLETLRDRCLALPTGQDACARPLRVVAGLYLEPTVVETLELEPRASWDETSVALTVQALTRGVVSAHSDRLPGVPVFEQDVEFARLWLLADALVEASNAVLEVYDRERGPVGAGVDALIAETRPLVRDHLSWILETTYHRARIGRRRGQPDEVEPYLGAMHPFAKEFLVVRADDLRNRVLLGMKAQYMRGWGSLAEEDPYDERWVRKWLEKSKHYQGKEVLLSNAALLRSVVPQTHSIARFAAEAWKKAGEPEGAISVLQEATEIAHDPEVALTLDEALAEASRAPGERTATLEPAVARFPLHGPLRERLASALLWWGELDAAEALYRPLLQDADMFDEACTGLSNVVAYRKDRAAVQRHFESCLEHAPNKWRRSYVHQQIAALASAQGDYATAQAQLGEAGKRIGGAGYVLLNGGFVAELRQDYEEATQFYKRASEHYARSSSGQNALAQLALRRSDAKGAKEAVLAFEYLDPDRHLDLYDKLGRAQLALGEFDAFVKRVHDQPGEQAFEALADLYASLGDFEAEIELAKRGLEMFPEGHFESRRLRALVDLGRYAEARPGLREAFEKATHNKWYRLQLVRTLVGEGELDEARRLTNEWTGIEPLSRDAAEMRYWVARGAGRTDLARREVRTAATWAPLEGTTGFRTWWYWQKRWLEREVALGLEHASKADLDHMVARAREVTHRIPHDLEMWPMLSSLLRARGETEAAAEAMARATWLQPGLGEAQVAQRP